MFDLARLAVHEVPGANDLPAECGADGLMSKADTEERDTPGEMTDQLDADSSLIRSARPRRNHDPLRFHSFNFSDCRLVVAANFDLGAQFSDVLNQVVSKRIVVVENEDHTPILAVPVPFGRREGDSDEHMARAGIRLTRRVEMPKRSRVKTAQN